MRKKCISGITVNDAPLEAVVIEEEKKPSAFTRKEFSNVLPLYRSSGRGKHREKKERNGPVKHKHQEANKRNLNSNVIRFVKVNKPIQIIVSILLAADKPLNTGEMREKANAILLKAGQASDLNLEVLGDYRFRNAIGKVRRSKLMKHITEYKPTRGAVKYFINPNKINMSWDDAIQLALDQKKRKYKRNGDLKKSAIKKAVKTVREKQEQTVDDLTLQEIIEKVVNLKINVTFSFSVE